MRRAKKNTGILFILGLAGLAVAVLSGLGEHVGFLASWCEWLSDGCKVTAAFTLFSIQVWVFGAVFYALLCLFTLVDRVLLDWLIPIGIGVEAALVGIMVFLGAACLFCLANAVVIALLALVHLRWEIRWKALALILVGFLAFGAPLAAQNELIPLYCAWVAPSAPAASVPPVSLDAGTPRPDAAPAVQYAEITQGNSQATGPVDALVTVFIYSDFRCPACRRMNKTVTQVMKEYDGKVRWVFKNFPLRMHPDAAIAAEGALCAAVQNKFWEYHDILFTTEETFTPESLTTIAGNLGLDQAAFRTCLDTHASQPQMDAEVAQGRAARVGSVPTIIINGQVKIGVMSAEDLRAALDAALADRKGTQ